MQYLKALPEGFAVVVCLLVECCDNELMWHFVSDNDCRQLGCLVLAVLRSMLALGRVSVVRGEGPWAGACCVDDYVRCTEPVSDYLTRYSGLQPGDLDPATSRHHLTTKKHAYMKLR